MEGKSLEQYKHTTHNAQTKFALDNSSCTEKYLKIAFWSNHKLIDLLEIRAADCFLV